jgi:hypothetical protein
MVIILIVSMVELRLTRKLQHAPDQNGHLNLARFGHFKTAATTNVKAKFRCPLPGKVEMSGFAL